MRYFYPAKTNHRRVRAHLMRVAMRKLAKGSVTGRRAVEGVTYILKGATYLPAFNAIKLDAAVETGMITAAQAAHHSGKGRGLRKGALWCEALNRAGIPVTLDYYTPGEVCLPDLIDTLVEACVEALTANLTQKDITRICKLFGLPIEQTGPAGWTAAHDVLQANAVMAAHYANDAMEAGDEEAAAAYAEQSQKIAAFTHAHAHGELPDVTIDLDGAMAQAAEIADSATVPMLPAPQVDLQAAGLQAAIEAAVAKAMAEAKGAA